MSEIRNKVYADLESFFPAQFTNPLSSSHWRQQKQRVILELKSIIDGEDLSEEIDKIDTMTRKRMKVKNFYGKDSEELKYDKDFEMHCIMLSPHTNQPVNTLSTKQYFTLLKFANDKAKKSKGAKKK